jgi:hypothetical protein
MVLNRHIPESPPFPSAAGRRSDAQAVIGRFGAEPETALAAQKPSGP